ncbi:type II toxin-antitoxin system HigB family toxin [Pseudomonas piscis]|uniref:Type II toxin-antitoxin system HigB family toxin n=1 Tax=Pseudomonas piscis TaxID=2614538 RepID=A0A7X1U6T2_9PSED|nr:type II toxin-antitoxin system HigB family toxin [Pseudomonas piscis]MQA56326.1 type II toxin-antitoxin system HigB family toxin [Pseudomonas piscis]
MRVITAKRIWEAKEKWPQSAKALDDWYRLIKSNSFADFSAIKAVFPAVDKVGPLHVFDVGGNKLRLIAVLRYTTQKLYIRYILNHREYDRGQWKEG